MKICTIKLTGTAPLLLHSDRLSNPLDVLTKEIKTYTGKRKKTDEDHEAIARLEWTGGMYFDEKIGPYLPARNIKAMLISAAKKTKDGPKAKTGLIIAEDKVKLEYAGPRSIDGLWKDGRFTDMRSVGIMGSRTMRCRPVFQEWSCTFGVFYDPAVVDKADILRFAETGGRLVGLGDYRVECCGDFGRFDAQEA